jgi:hypothetical protein
MAAFSCPRNVLTQSNSFRIDRIISGIRIVGMPPNVSVEDVKNTFEVPQDKEAIVYFEWTGPAGTHRFEGVWKNPSGREVGRSDFTADSASGKFSGSWKLFLNQNTQPGRWSIESWVDGQILGRYQIEVHAGTTNAAGTPRAEASRVPSLAEISRHATAATVFVQHIDKKGGGNVSGSGFFVSPNTVLTSFSVIEGAESLRLASGSKTFTVAGVIAWNRFQDWAVLRTAESSTDFLPLADGKSGGVGEHCVALTITGQGTRTLADGAVNSVLTKAKIGERLSVSIDALSPDFDAVKDDATGSPLINLRGQVFAIAVGPGTILTGSGWVRIVRSHNLFEADSPFEGLKVLAVPLKYFATTLNGTTLTSLAQLSSNKEFAPDVVNANYIQSGTIALKADAIGNPVGEAFVFRELARELQLFITWNVAEKFDGRGAIKVYDDSNRVVVDGRPQPTKTPPAGKWVVSPGNIPIDRLPPGTYRVDYLLNDFPAWRSFFRIIP